MRSPNKARCEVALPKSFGEGVFIRFTIDALERLEGEFGEKFIDVICDGLAHARPSIFKKVLECTVVGDQPIDIEALQGNIDETQARILDALFLTLHGRTVAEQQAKEDEDKAANLEKQLERMGQDPQMASALLFLQSFGAMATGPVSDQTKSDALPQEK